MHRQHGSFVSPRSAKSKWSLAALAMAMIATIGGFATPRSISAQATPSANPALAAMLPAAVKAAGALNIAISLAYPPMEYSDAGSTDLKGADIDLAREVAARLGLKPNFQNVEFAQLIPSVTTGRSDMIWTAMLDLKKRQDRLTFLDYFKTGDQFFAPAEYADKFKTIPDLCGETVTVATGTNWVTVVQDLSKAQCAPSKQIAIVQVPSLAEQILQMKQKRAVAAMIGFEGVLDLQQHQPGKWIKVGTLLDQGYYGVGFRKDATQLQAAVAAAIKSMIDDGSYVKILKQYGLQEAAVQDMKTNAGN